MYYYKIQFYVTVLQSYFEERTEIITPFEFAILICKKQPTKCNDTKLT